MNRPWGHRDEDYLRSLFRETAEVMLKARSYDAIEYYARKLQEMADELFRRSGGDNAE